MVKTVGIKGLRFIILPDGSGIIVASRLKWTFPREKKVFSKHT